MVLLMTFLKHIALHILLFFAFVSLANAQSSKDSIKNLKIDEQIAAYSKAGESLLASNVIESEKNLVKAYNLAKSINNKQEQGNALHNLGKLYMKKNKTDIAKRYFEKAIIIREEIKDNENLAKSLNQLGTIYQDRGLLDTALELYEQSYKAAEAAKYYRGMAFATKQEGNVNYIKGQHQQAISLYMKALDFFEKSKSDDGMLSTYLNIGGVYATIYKRKEALYYFKKTLVLAKKINDAKEIGNANNSIATVFLRKDTTGQRNIYYNVDSGTKYLKEANKYYKMSNYPLGLSKCYNNLAQVYLEAKKYTEALKQIDSAVVISTQLGNKNELVFNHVCIGQCYSGLNNYKKSIENFSTAIKIAKEVKFTEGRLYAYDFVSQTHAKFLKFDSAYIYLYKFTKLQDTFRNGQTMKIVQEMETKYQTSKKEQLIKEGTIKNEAQRKQLFVVVIFLILVGVFAIFALMQFLQKRKANKLLVYQNVEINRKNVEIEEQRNQVMIQRDLIKEQQKGIMDSIHYASRIQQAILPGEDYLDNLLGRNYFILYKPRDIVSGDFYWIGTRNNKKIVVAADCTGHGVPGAFMSMLGTAFLNEITNLLTENLNAATILNELRDYVISSLKQTGKKGEQKDGMDVCMYIYDEKTMTLEYAGANNPLFIVRKNPDIMEEWTNGRITQEIFETEDEKGCALISIKADKMPIGIYAETRPFESVTIQLLPGDTLFNFSDGYVDQFGGPKNQKFLTKRFKKLLTNITSLPFEEQYEKLDSAIEDWKSGYEQIDDILVIGYKV
jgi:serine phosphatase RsbU (regulator of sigma subunit)